MKVYLNKITGIEDAAISMYMSKRSWTPEKDMEIRNLCKRNLIEGWIEKESPEKEFLDLVNKIIKYGIDYGHTTLLRYIDISFTVDGLHRAGQDDWDSHAERMDSRIVRASTRLGTFSDGEKSDYYKDKVLYPFEAFQNVGIEIPNNIEVDGIEYIRADFGYIAFEHKDNQDVKRGLYPMGIPSTFIFKTQYPELGHIYQHRNNDSNANPEVKELAEKCKEELMNAFPILAENLSKIKMQ